MGVLLTAQLVPQAAAPGYAHEIGQFGVGDGDIQTVTLVIQMDLLRLFLMKSMESGWVVT